MARPPKTSNGSSSRKRCRIIELQTASAKETNPNSFSNPDTTNTRLDAGLSLRVAKMESPKSRGKSIMESYVPQTAERRIGNGFKKNRLEGIRCGVKLNRTMTN